MKKKELLNEIMGVPKAINPLVEYIYQIALDLIDQQSNYGYEDEGQITYKDPKTGEKTEYETYRTIINKNGDEFNELLVKTSGFSNELEYIKSEEFGLLPLWRPNFMAVIVGIPDELYEKEETIPMEASVNVNELDKKLKNLGKVKVLSNIDIRLDIVTPLDNYRTNKNFLSELKSVISHEILHLYQVYKQVETGKPSHFGKEQFLNMISSNKMMRDLNIPSWNDFLHLVYLHLSYENNARITQLYTKFKELGIDTKEEFLKGLKKTLMWRELKSLEEFDANKFIEEFTLPNPVDGGEVDFAKMLSAVLNGESLDPMERLKSMGINIDSNEEALKSLIVLWNRFIKILSQDLELKGFDFKMTEVPEKALKDPKLFFKFFEDRFKKKADKWKRKIYRVGSLLINGEETTLQ
jgi:hypothetical protein